MVRTWIVGILVLIVDSIRMRMGMVAVEAAADFLWLYCWSLKVTPMDLIQFVVLLQVFFRMFLKSMRMERAKSVRYVR